MSPSTRGRKEKAPGYPGAFSVLLAEMVRFELTIQVTPNASLAGKCLRPLGHISTLLQPPKAQLQLRP